MSVASVNGTLTTSGTKVPLTSVPTFCDWFLVNPLGTNAGILYVGGSTVAAATLIGFPMGVGTGFMAPPITRNPTEVPPYDLSLVYVDGDTSGDKFTVLYGRKNS